jgi:hypothetical protein
MDARNVDLRDVEAEVEAVYRVYFWSDRRRRCEEYELTDSRDVNDVLAWIDAHANGREVEATVVVDRTAVYLIGPLNHSDPP